MKLLFSGKWPHFFQMTNTRNDEWAKQLGLCTQWDMDQLVP